MEYEKIKQLMEDFGNSKLNSIELDFPDGTKINMKKDDVTKVTNVSNDKVIEEDFEQIEINENLDKNNDAYDGNVLKSPMVGTFYAKPNPNSAPYVEVGKKVKKGDIVCIIEAMKLMNEIESEFDGEIKEILVKDGEPVEYGKPLFIIK